MSNIQASEVKKLRQQTGAGIMDCKQALKASDNDFNQAIDWLKKKGLSTAAKKSGREAGEGLISSYIHGNGRIGVLVEVNSETDFVARNKDFKSFVKDLSLHIAAMRPLFIKEEDIDEKIRQKEKSIFEEQAKLKTQKKEALAHISEGLYKKWLKEVCLLNQIFAKQNTEGNQSVEMVLNDLISRIGENIVIRRFIRFELGETTQKNSSNLSNEAQQVKKG